MKTTIDATDLYHIIGRIRVRSTKLRTITADLDRHAAELEKMLPQCELCKRYVPSPCQFAGVNTCYESGPWDFACRGVSYGEP